MRDTLKSCITGFRKSHGTQNSLVVMLEKCKRAIDKGDLPQHYLRTSQKPLIP